MLPLTFAWKDDFTYYYYNERGDLEAAKSCSKVPEHIEDFCTIHDAIKHVQHLGAIPNSSQHNIKNQFHSLCLAVLRQAIIQYGVYIPLVLRGVRSDRSDSEHKILFGTTNRQVAAFYGEKIKQYENIKGLIVHSHLKSVVSGDYSAEMDEEIIFFNDII